MPWQTAVISLFRCPGKQIISWFDVRSHARKRRLLLCSDALSDLTRANADYFLVLMPWPICCWAPQVPLSTGHDGSFGFLHSYLRGSQAGHRGRGGQPSRGGHLIGSAGISMGHLGATPSLPLLGHVGQSSRFTFSRSFSKARFFLRSFSLSFCILE